MRTSLATATAVSIFALSTNAVAQDGKDWGVYLQISGGVFQGANSDNEGTFSEDFALTGAALDGTTILAGTEFGFETELQTGVQASWSSGIDFGAARTELEVTFTRVDIDTHLDPFAGALDLTDVDIAGLDATQTAPVGMTIGQVLSDGRGRIDTIYVMANVVFDLELEHSMIEPYFGGGIGVGYVEVTYEPSGVNIASDQDAALAWQLMAGVAYPIAEHHRLFGELVYRGTSDVDIEADLFPGDFEVENRTVGVELGYRYDFD